MGFKLGSGKKASASRLNFSDLGVITSFVQAPLVTYLVVAGGGGGASQGSGGGAGGYLSNTYTVNLGQTYVISVGAGGAVATRGSNSSIFSNAIITIGGGRGGVNPSPADGGPGGSGGGGHSGSTIGQGGLGTPGQGNPGGNNTQAGGYGGAGGGGAGVLGANVVGTGQLKGGNGGNGLVWVNGVYYAGGGGGWGYTAQGGGGTGGLGGGGKGTSFPGASVPPGLKATAGIVNTGGGGGGGLLGGPDQLEFLEGGSGVAIITYPQGFNQATGTTGSNVVYSGAGGSHTYTFYSSGSITF
jgi:hypothetical protein